MKKILLVVLSLFIMSCSAYAKEGGWSGTYVDDLTDVVSPFDERADGDLLTWSDTYKYWEHDSLDNIGNSVFLKLDCSNDPLTSTLDMGGNPISNIGSTATDFTATGGLNLGDDLVVENDITISTGSIISASGTIDFDDEDRIGTGAITGTSLDLADGDITSVTTIYLDQVTHDGDSDTRITFSSDKIFMTVGNANFLEMVELGNMSYMVINESGSGFIDFRIESDTEENMFFLDAGENRIGIGTNLPDAFFSIGASSQLQVDASGNLLTTGTVEGASFDTTGHFKVSSEIWGTAVTTGISTWHDTDEWVEIDTTDKDGRYIKVVINATEDTTNNWIGWGNPSEPMTIFDVYADGAWQEIAGANLHSHCGEQGTRPLAEALDGTNAWLHYANEVHWFIIDLGSSKNITKVHGRSNYTYEPTDVDIFVAESLTAYNLTLDTNATEASITASTGIINFDNENLKTTGTLEVTGEFIGDIDLADDTPHFTFRDTDTDDALQWHFDMNDQTYGIYQLWRGTDTGGAFNVDPDIPVLYMDTNNDWFFTNDVDIEGTGTFSEVYLTDFDSSNKGIADALNNTVNCGVLNAITITDEGGLNISWTSGEIWDCVGLATITTDASSTACTDNNINYLYWDRSGGGTALTLSTTEWDRDDDDVPVAVIVCQNSDVWGINTKYPLNEREHAIDTAMNDVLKVVVANGLVVSEDTDATNDLDVQISAGTFYHFGSERHDLAAGFNTRTIAMKRWYHSGGAWTTDTNAEIDPTQYDNLTNLTAVTANKYYKSIFMYSDNIIHWIYPQAEYSTVAQAIAAPLPTIPVMGEYFPRSVAVVMKGSDTTFPTAGSERWIDIRPMFGTSIIGNVTDHSSLSNLNWSVAGHTFDAAVDFNSQNVTNMGTLGCGAITVTDASITLTRNSDGTLHSTVASDTSWHNNRIYLQRAGNTVAVPHAVENTWQIWTIDGMAYDGNSYERVATIGAYVNGSVSDGVVPTRLDFGVTNAAGVFDTDAMRLTGTGLTLAGTLDCGAITSSGTKSSLGTIYFQNGLGDILSLYQDRLDGTTMYGFGVESGTLYYKSAEKYRWYVATNADGGTSDIMELNNSGDLTLAGTLGCGAITSTALGTFPGLKLTSDIDMEDEGVYFDNIDPVQDKGIWFGQDALEGGAVIKLITSQTSGKPIFLVESSGLSQRLRVEHDGYVSTSNAKIAMNYSGSAFANADGYLYFASDAYLMWDESADNFIFPKNVQYNGTVGIGIAPAGNSLYIQHGSDTTLIQRIDGADATEYLGFGIETGYAIITAGYAGSGDCGLKIYTSPTTEALAMTLDKDANLTLVGDLTIATSKSITMGAGTAITMGTGSSISGYNASFNNDLTVDGTMAVGAALSTTKVIYGYTNSGSKNAGYFTSDQASSVRPVVNILQDSSSGEQPCLELDQDDISEGFIDFVGSDRGIVTLAPPGTGPVQSVASIRVEVNGTKYVIPLFADQ